MTAAKPKPDERSSCRRAQLEEMLVTHAERLARQVDAARPARFNARFDTGDVVQEVFLSALSRTNSFRGRCEGEFASWLNSIARTKMITMCRHHARCRRSVDREVQPLLAVPCKADERQAPVTSVLAAESRETLMNGVSHLPSEQRNVVTMYYMNGQTVESISRQLGISNSRIRRLLQHSIVALRKTIGPDDDYHR